MLPSGNSHFTQNSHCLPQGQLVKTRPYVFPLVRPALWEIAVNEVMSQWEEAEKQHFWKLSGHCVGGGDMFRYLYGLCIRDPFIQGEEVLLPVMLPQQAYREPWKSLTVLAPCPLMRHPLLHAIEPAELGEGRNGRDGPSLVWPNMSQSLVTL